MKCEDTSSEEHNVRLQLLCVALLKSNIRHNYLN